MHQSIHIAFILSSLYIKEAIAPGSFLLLLLLPSTLPLQIDQSFLFLTLLTACQHGAAGNQDGSFLHPFMKA